MELDAFSDHLELDAAMELDAPVENPEAEAYKADIAVDELPENMPVKEPLNWGEYVSPETWRVPEI